MAHPLVTQLWFTRGEFVRCLNDVTPQEAVIQVRNMNCLSWIVGHLASQELFLWLESAQGINLVPGLHEKVGYRSLPTTPSWVDMWNKWNEITNSADNFLSTLEVDNISLEFSEKGVQPHEDIGRSLLRNIFHYWFHIEEAHAIRQTLGHENLPKFVGDLSEVRYF
jgi:hypothetical protein